MITQETLNSIEQEVKNLFQKLEAEVQIFSKAQEDGSISIEIEAPDPQMLIGENGQTLSEIQHLLRTILRKKINEPIWLLLDINGYRKNKETYIKQLANSAADDVALIGKEKELPPMNASDRRIVHMELAKRTDVVGESIGEEPERRVVIKPK